MIMYMAKQNWWTNEEILGEAGQIPAIWGKRELPEKTSLGLVVY